MSVYAFFCVTQPLWHETLFRWLFLTTSLGLRPQIDVSAARPLTSPFCIDRTVCQYSVVPSALKGNKVSVWTESSPTSSVSQGFESSTKYYPLLSLPPAESPLTASSQRASLPSTMPSAPFSTPSAAFTTMESSRDCKYICFPLSHPSSLHLLDRPENIPHFSNDSNSDIVIVKFPFPLTLFAHLLTKKKILHSPNEQLTSLASSFGYVFPGVVKKYRPRKTLIHLVHRYDHFRTHTQTKYIVSSLRNYHRLRFPLQLSPFLCRQLHYLRPACRL